eukprot:TRINITY_DN33476_c0_g1_i1.p1 TRINITY_DN33476_c0_g1~~TRINITY_DN33476_c0_g1_i1.p1  ORF type:complete len:101 (-),score=12.44 TRINITY_DN33476_c0_g1_i1:331-591(-)
MDRIIMLVWECVELIIPCHAANLPMLLQRLHLLFSFLKRCSVSLLLLSSSPTLTTMAAAAATTPPPPHPNSQPSSELIAYWNSIPA